MKLLVAAYFLTLLIAGGAPYDGSAEDVIHNNHRAMEVLYSIMASAGLLFAIGCLVFNLLFRTRKRVES